MGVFLCAMAERLGNGGAQRKPKIAKGARDFLPEQVSRVGYLSAVDICYSRPRPRPSSDVCHKGLMLCLCIVLFVEVMTVAYCLGTTTALG